MKVKISIDDWDSAFESRRNELLAMLDSFAQLLLYSETDVTKVSVYRVDYPKEIAFYNKVALPDLGFYDEKKKKKKA